MPFIFPLTVRPVKTLPFTLKGPLIVVVLDVLFIITSPPQGFILNFHQKRGVIPIKNSTLMPGIGRDNTERYSSLNKLFTAPFSDNSAHFNETPRSSVMLLI